jgi:asparagine synthase (glutamine-hydrolysing)
MCGISGISTFGVAGVPEGTLRRMTDAIRHRGPDDEGCFRDRSGRAALGHRRLSIIDLASGHQPVFNEDGSVAVVFNGEIYNYGDLTNELEKKGHRFATKSDTEVLVHLYEEFGPECVKRLRGMFAFAIWDSRQERLFLTRDRVGKKPAYYAVVNGTLYFASEIQALYEVAEIPKEIDYDAVDHYLTYSYIPSPRSIYKSIRKLPPAHSLIFDASGLTITRYWQPDYRRKTEMGYEDAKRELVRILTKSVELRLISDVPLGAFLSGGLDSSAVVAIMSRLSDRPVKTFSIGFPDQDYNELAYAQEVARLYKTDHREFMVEPDRLDVLGDIVRHYGEPYGDSSAVPTWHLSRVTREHVTVALNGDGGDELFGGYPWYSVNHQFSRLANPLTRGLARGLLRLGTNAIPRRFQRGLELLDRNEGQRFQSLQSYVDARDRATLYHEEFQRRITASAEAYLCALYDESLASAYDRAFSADFQSYLPEDLMVKVDRASMAHGLECRSPILDQELVEFASSLPPGWKIQGKRRKRILKDAVAAWFPPGFVDRPKMGFSVPVGKWFRGELKPFIADKLLNGPLCRLPLLRRGPLEHLLSEHFDGARNHEARIWNLLMLGLWFEEYGQ